MHGKPAELIADAMIAATAVVHNLTVVTRNLRDFEGLGCPPLAPSAEPDVTANRRLAAILAAHVAGHSRLMGADEEHARTPQSTAPRAPRSEDRRAQGSHPGSSPQLSDSAFCCSYTKVQKKPTQPLVPRGRTW